MRLSRQRAASQRRIAAPPAFATALLIISSHGHLAIARGHWLPPFQDFLAFTENTLIAKASDDGLLRQFFIEYRRLAFNISLRRHGWLPTQYFDIIGYAI